MSKKLTLEYVKGYFDEQGCELLEKEYKNSKTKMRYRCSCGNVSEIAFTTFKAGHRCNICGSKKRIEKTKHAFEYVYNYFKEQKCELLEEKYINNSTNMKYKCSCGEKGKINFNNFQNGHRCVKCSGNEKLTYKFVKLFFEDNKCELLEKEYKNTHTKMRYLCECGKENQITFSDFQQGRRCQQCGFDKIGDQKRLSFESVKQFFKDNNCELLATKYKNTHTLMQYRCDCGNISKIGFHTFQAGHRCKKCAIEKNSGENNWNYNPNLTDEDRIDRRKIPGYTQWAKNIYKRDNYTCQKCYKTKNKNNKYKKIHAHHIEGYAENPNIRLDLNNGITFCSPCHMKFHYIYGKKNVNRKQLNKFLKVITSGI